jgi:sphingoid base N-palmitoyltransferase
MMVHHFATISLMVMSWSANMVRVGSLVLCVHDAVDYFLEVNNSSIQN